MSDQQSLVSRKAAGRIIIPFDVSIAEAPALAGKMNSAGAMLFKHGYNTLTRGSEATELLAFCSRKYGARAMIDGKFHDIPNTVANAIAGTLETAMHCNYKVDIINVHAAGGRPMMEAAAKAASDPTINFGIKRPLVIAVTILTSMGQEDLQQIGIDRPLLEEVILLAKLAKDSGMDGVVASALHVAAIKKECGQDFITVCPGIRFSDGNTNDQKQVATPYGAAFNGADYFVIGREIIKAEDPKAAFERACNEIEAGWAAQTEVKL